MALDKLKYTYEEPVKISNLIINTNIAEGDQIVLAAQVFG
jgi:hypothetical protein